MSLETLRHSFHARFRRLRNTNRIILSDDFSIAYNHATKEEKKKIQSAISNVDILAIKEFITTHIAQLTPFHKMSISRLRKIGCNLRLPLYWRMDKVTLIQEIEDAIKKLKESSE